MCSSWYNNWVTQQAAISAEASSRVQFAPTACHLFLDHVKQHPKLSVHTATSIRAPLMIWQSRSPISALFSKSFHAFGPTAAGPQWACTLLQWYLPPAAIKQEAFKNKHGIRTRMQRKTVPRNYFRQSTQHHDMDFNNYIFVTSVRSTDRRNIREEAGII